jgi:hypothetical protein
MIHASCPVGVIQKLTEMAAARHLTNSTVFWMTYEQGCYNSLRDLYRNPFTSGFFVLANENFYQRLTEYINTDIPSERDRMWLKRMF